MGLTYVRQLPSPEEIIAEAPVSPAVREAKAARDAKIKEIFTGGNDQFLLIVGPCSADNEDAVRDYMGRLAGLQEKVKDKILIVPRIYTNKPRTTGEGYKGMMHQPDPNDSANIVEGLKAIRRLHLRVAEDTGMTAADEMLYPENYAYLSDILSYIAVGARSVENQQHRLTVSGVEVPVGMKNPTSGDITVMLNAIKAAQIGHNFIFRGHEVETTGNPLAHAIMRGYVDQYGRNFPNYHYEDIVYLIEKYLERDLSFPSIIIDTNHANSNKKYLEQPRIAYEIVRNRHYDPTLKKHIKGLMMESYIEGGCQGVGEGVYGKSITDPCLSWEDTERTVCTIADKL
ncbi:3-deoxy-7-phosphoheptulonate synthase [Anaerotalea alkaliphila]|uniref:Phospho-2-dehydro-3-deoxyheptonate aldolase n=1 Tax=Anaerotalea alkaliphila TaxID=2662126 RepID=A0A7X5HW72_9FIRM|nr:3-deoxy-7-phosphoheptulonate synthase [Anaerotalea alkaliphila]NDL67767.1 3-deoxy-7-phosphoheptulonate synthase [Anaerotalea alkaliphila]